MESHLTSDFRERSVNWCEGLTNAVKQVLGLAVVNDNHRVIELNALVLILPRWLPSYLICCLRLENVRRPAF